MYQSNDYRDLAFQTYRHRCAYCGCGVQEILEVAHLDGNRDNNDVNNLAILCPNCHKMHDIDLIPTDIVVQLRDSDPTPNWSKRMKDAGEKAAETKKRKSAAKKAWRTRKNRYNSE